MLPAVTEDTLSIWGWGEAARFPDGEQRAAMGQWAQALLGFDVGPPQDPVPPEALELSAPRSAALPPASLGALCSSTTRDRAAHAYGRSYEDTVRGFRGLYPHPPDVVARPRSEQDVVDLLDWCGASDLAAIPFGGGTSVVGGVEADVSSRWAGAVSIDLKGLDRVLEVDDVSRAARIQAGATGPVLNGQLSQHGFELRCFPQSYQFATLGGWIVTRAGGHYATVRTHIDDLVESVRMITPTGPWAARRRPGSGAGPSPDRMVLGSEGILGLVTEAWVRVVRPPRWRASASVRFSDWDRAVHALRGIAQSGLAPANCRLLDGTEARINSVAQDGSHVLLLGFESADHPLEAPMSRALEIARSAGGSCTRGARYRDAGAQGGDPTASSWRDAFFAGPYLRDVLVSLGVIVDTFETCITWDRFDELHGALQAELGDAMRRICGAGTLSCRVTHVYPDGPAPYYTFLAPGRPGAELEQWAELKAVASDLLIRHGATITHHHAVGRMHRPWYAQQRPEPLGRMLRAMKNTVDPAGLLNPGVLVAEENP